MKFPAKTRRKDLFNDRAMKPETFHLTMTQGHCPMNDEEFGTTDDYCRVFKAVRTEGIADKHLALLQAHFNAPEHNRNMGATRGCRRLRRLQGHQPSITAGSPGESRGNSACAISHSPQTGMPGGSGRWFDGPSRLLDLPAKSETSPYSTASISGQTIALPTRRFVSHYQSES